MCPDCFKQFKRDYAKKRNKEFGRYNFGIMNCAVCGEETIKWRKTQLRCKNCSSFATNPTKKSYSNPYANGEGKGYCWMHRRITEELLQRKLTSSEVVHHLDENPQNNNLNNIIVLSRSSHAKLHAFLRRAFIEQSMNENLENCWDTLRASITTAWLETAGAKVIKLWEIGQSAAEPLSDISYEEGSEAMHQTSQADDDMVHTETEMAIER